VTPSKTPQPYRFPVYLGVLHDGLPDHDSTSPRWREGPLEAQLPDRALIGRPLDALVLIEGPIPAYAHHFRRDNVQAHI
jgi:hypothetical protein